MQKLRNQPTATSVCVCVQHPVRAGKKSQDVSNSSAPGTGSSKGEPALTAGMIWNKIKHLIPVRKDHHIVSGSVVDRAQLRQWLLGSREGACCTS